MGGAWPWPGQAAREVQGSTTPGKDSLPVCKAPQRSAQVTRIKAWSTHRDMKTHDHGDRVHRRGSHRLEPWGQGREQGQKSRVPFIRMQHRTHNRTKHRQDGTEGCQHAGEAAVGRGRRSPGGGGQRGAAGSRGGGCGEAARASCLWAGVLGPGSSSENSLVGGPERVCHMEFTQGTPPEAQSGRVPLLWGELGPVISVGFPTSLSACSYVPRLPHGPGKHIWRPDPLT